MKKNKKIAALFVLAMTFSAGVTAYAEAPSDLSSDIAVDLPRFFEVTPGRVYRGAQPTDNGIHMLLQYGIRTVLDLRDEDPQQIAAEGRVVQANGLKFISIPLNGFFAPSDENMSRIQSILNDESLQPVFVHCQHGQDRTGLSVGLYRVEAQKQSAKLAQAEMVHFGFHKELLGLYLYFKEKTRGL